MKKNLVLSLFFFLLAMSCNEEPNIINHEQPVQDSFMISPEEAGNLHTKVTEITFKHYQTWLNEELTVDDMLQKFYSEIMVKELSEIMNISKDEMVEVLEENLKLSKNNISSWEVSSIDVMYDEKSSTLYDDLMNIVKKDLNEQAYLEEISLLKERYLNKMDETQLQTVIEIANSSYLYWSKNMNNWYDRGRNSRSMPPCGASSIVDGDINGAISGFLSGAITGFGAIGGAALGATAGTLIGSIRAVIQCCGCGNCKCK